MRSTMMDDYPLSIQMIFEHGRRIHARSEVVTLTPGGTRRASFGEVADRADRLASALARLGIERGDRVGTLCWNTQEHLESYFAVPSMGAVLHTLNLRLFPEQLTYVINHAEDRVVIVDSSLLPLLARVAADLKTVERYIVIGDGDASALDAEVLRYDELLAAEPGGFTWPVLDERDAAAMCYTTGTTGEPKGVAYSHRSTFVHALAGVSGGTQSIGQNDRLLLIVPMFHAMAWGLPFEAWLVGADLVLPGPLLQAEPLTRAIAEEKVTFAGAVPTIWNDVLRYGEDHELDLSSLRTVVCGGSAVPRALIERFEQRYGVRVVQGWGMTETSPLAAIANPPKGSLPEDDIEWRARTGRVVHGIELRICDDDGNVLPWDGVAVGEIEVRGPWVTAHYYKDDTPEKFHDGWLRTGDVASVTPEGFVQITDRAKDVIKSGGEWISSVEVENTLMAHPDIVEAAVIGVPDETWDERPLACVVLREGSARDAEALRGFLADKVAKWWLPERWSFVEEIPKTSVGKFDKKVLRARYADGELDVVELEGAKRA